MPDSGSKVSNPLLLDDRTGSGDLLPYLRARSVPVTLTRMAYGDASFQGYGPDGCPTPVGIEIKQVSDVLQCITDGRFAGHQLPGLIDSYEYIWLIMEGAVRGDANSGILQTMRGGQWRNYSYGARTFMYRELEQWLLTISIKGGVRIVRTFNRDDTATFLVNLYRWWTSKEWESHRSHLAANLSHVPDRAILTRPTLCRLVAKELPGIGWEKAAEVAKAFSSVLNMAVAEEDDWADIAGIGKKTAAKVVAAIRSNR